MSHGTAVHVRNPLKQEGNGCDTVRHEIDGQKFKKCPILLAIPAERKQQRKSASWFGSPA
jgi:hypothetical protein